MKRFALLLTFLVAPLASFAAPPKTAEAFLAAVKAAYEAKDSSQLEALTWWDGVDDGTHQMMNKMDAMFMKSVPAKITNVTLEPLPEDFNPIQVAFGKRYEPNVPPTGVVKIDYKEGVNEQSSSIVYSVVKGAYYRIGTKLTDLNWQGPRDETFIVNVMGNGQNKVHTAIKYNASGVDLEKPKAASSSGFPAQSIKEVTVTSDDDSVDVTLSIRKGTKIIYESAPLKGKGTLHYPPAK